MSYVIPIRPQHADLLSRSHHEAPIRGGGEDALVPLAQRLLTNQRWSILWRSIIASSQDATLFPYCRYIRTLDFRDLGNLLDEDQFRNKLAKYVSFTLCALSQHKC